MWVTYVGKPQPRQIPQLRDGCRHLCDSRSIGMAHVSHFARFVTEGTRWPGIATDRDEPRGARDVL